MNIENKDNYRKVLKLFDETHNLTVHNENERGEAICHTPSRYYFYTNDPTISLIFSTMRSPRRTIEAPFLSTLLNVFMRPGIRIQKELIKYRHENPTQ